MSNLLLLPAEEDDDEEDEDVVVVPDKVAEDGDSDNEGGEGEGRIDGVGRDEVAINGDSDIDEVILVPAEVVVDDNDEDDEVEEDEPAKGIDTVVTPLHGRSRSNDALGKGADDGPQRRRKSIVFPHPALPKTRVCTTARFALLELK